MIKTIYLVRHANKYKCEKDYVIKYDKIRPLSEKGIRSAKKISKCPMFLNVDCLYSSEFSRSWQTIAFLSEKLGTPINISSSFNERRKPSNIKITNEYRKKQLLDDDYKISDGESSNDVFLRFNKEVNNILSSQFSNIIISSHKNAITMYLKKYCEYKIDNTIKYYYNNKLIFDGNWNDVFPVFVIKYEDKKLLDIKCIFI